MSWWDIAVISGTEIVGDFALKKYADTGAKAMLGLGLTGYAGVVYFLIRALRKAPVMLVNSAWDGMSNIVETLAALIILGERLSSPVQYLGLAMVGTGLVLLKLPLV
jgi:multidrug transporter EmrE-like cation transporter